MNRLRNVAGRIRRGVSRRVRALARRSTRFTMRRVSAWYEACSAPGGSFSSVARQARTWPRLPEDASALDRLWEQLRAPRSDQPQVLRPNEWDAVRHVASLASPSPSALEPLVALGDAEAVHSSRPTLLVIDIRPAQRVVPCGTRTHARAVLDTVLGHVPDTVRVEVIAESEEPFPDLDHVGRIDGRFEFSRITEVGAFLALAAREEPRSIEEFVSLTTKPIRSVGIWLDAIIGLYPHHWLPTADAFFSYQFTLECAHRFGELVALSEVSAAEARMSFGAEVPIVISGSRVAGPPDPAVVERPVVGARDQFVVVVGNSLPHKNVAAGVLGAAGALRGASVGIVVLANLSEAEEQALREMTEDVGLPASDLQVLRRIPGPEHSWLMRQAEALIVPSLHEGLSLPVLEALAVGTPVVLSDIAAHRELLGPGPWWFDPQAPTTVAPALLWALRDRNAAATRQLGAERQRPDFDRVIADVTRRLTEHLDAIAAPS